MDTLLKMFNFENTQNLQDALLIFAGKIINTVLIILLSYIVVKVGNKFITTIIKNGNKLRKKSVSNFEGIIKSVFKWVVYIIAFLSIFTKVFPILDTSSLITTLGVSGLAISIGAQSLISDIISGFFIIVEGQMEIGDYVTLGDISGNIVEFDIRCLKLQNYENEIVYIPYGEIRKTINKSKSDSSVVVNLLVSYKENLASVLEIANEVVNEYNHKDLREKLKVLPTVSLDEKTYTVRLFGKAASCMDWEIEREVSSMLLDKANQKNIRLGFDVTNK